MSVVPEISLVLPYWERRSVTMESLENMARIYQSVSMEVVIVDDGSPVESMEDVSGMPWDVRVIRLPLKSGALNPCVPLNVGVRAARGKLIALSNPEIEHRTAVLPDLANRWTHRRVATAACYCEDRQRWHNHSVKAPKGFHFLSVMQRDAFDRAGGFDEEYRDGQGYEDWDFVLRIKRAGLRVEIHDDIVVFHPKRGATSAWPSGGLDRNRSIFESKWGSPRAIA